MDGEKKLANSADSPYNLLIVFHLSRCGGTADALVSGTSGSNLVGVQIPSPAVDPHGSDFGPSLFYIFRNKN